MKHLTEFLEDINAAFAAFGEAVYKGLSSRFFFALGILTLLSIGLTIILLFAIS
jgi:hypothetical protein